MNNEREKISGEKPAKIAKGNNNSKYQKYGCFEYIDKRLIFGRYYGKGLRTY